jgi:hypothetical protein
MHVLFRSHPPASPDLRECELSGKSGKIGALPANPHRCQSLLGKHRRPCRLHQSNVMKKFAEVGGRTTK